MFPNILNTLCSKSDILLSWSHYRILLQVEDKKARKWYEKEALEEEKEQAEREAELAELEAETGKEAPEVPVIEEKKDSNEEA